MEKELEELESTRGNSVTKKEEGKEERKGVGGAYRYFKQLCKSSEEYYEQFDPEELKEKRQQLAAQKLQVKQKEITEEQYKQQEQRRKKRQQRQLRQEKMERHRQRLERRQQRQIYKQRKRDRGKLQPVRRSKRNSNHPILYYESDHEKMTNLDADQPSSKLTDKQPNKTTMQALGTYELHNQHRKLLNMQKQADQIISYANTNRNQRIISQQRLFDILTVSGYGYQLSRQWQLLLAYNKSLYKLQQQSKNIMTVGFTTQQITQRQEDTRVLMTRINIQDIDGE